MKNLQLVKSEKFGETSADIYSSGEDMFMTVNQLADCLGYADRSGVQKLVDRNPYLNGNEFSGWDNLSLPQGGTQKVRVFTEDGIYEVAMLSGQPKAKEFRAWIRGVLKALRKGQAVNSPDTDKLQIQQQRANAMLMNAKTRMFNAIMSVAKDNKLSPIAAEVFGLAALEQVTGRPINYRPECERTYSATEIAQELGVSANKIGKIANANGLKTIEYGITVMDKSPYSAKEVSAFRYNDKGVSKIKELI